MDDEQRNAAVIALGGNLGEPRASLSRAVRSLASLRGIDVAGVAGLYNTAAVGGPDQPDYLNTVVLLGTRLAARALLAAAHEVEADAGRQRLERWGPRTLDVDIIAYGQLSSDDPHLTLPHPRAHLRAFVLAPWAELTPEWELTAAGETRTVREWLETVRDQQIELAEPKGWWQ